MAIHIKIICTVICMKILILAPDVDFTKLSGGSMHHIGIAKALSKMKNQVVVMGYGKDEILKGNGFEIRTYSWIRNPVSKTGSKNKAAKIDSILNEINPDVLYYRIEPFEAFGCYTKTKTPVVLEINYNFFTKHSTGFWTRFWLLRNFLLKRWLKKVFSISKTMICVSDSVRRGFLRNNISGNFKIVPNGVNLDEFSIRKKIRNQIIFVGNCSKQQGVDSLAEASEILENEKTAHEILVIGGEGLDSCKSDSIVFTGDLSRHETIKTLCESEIGVAPYKEEKEPYGYSPIKIFEYMAAGLAVIASNTEWNREIIKDGENGLLFEAGNSYDLAEKIKMIMENEKLKRRLQKNARKGAVEFYNWNRAARQIVEICKEAIDNCGI